MAKEYLKKKEELKTYDINMFLLEAQRVKEQIQQIEEKYETASEELESANIRYGEMKAEYESIEEEVDGIDYSIETAKNPAQRDESFKAAAGRED